MSPAPAAVKSVRPIYGFGMAACGCGTSHCAIKPHRVLPYYFELGFYRRPVASIQGVVPTMLPSIAHGQAADFLLHEWREALRAEQAALSWTVRRHTAP